MVSTVIAFLEKHTKTRLGVIITLALILLGLGYGLGKWRFEREIDNLATTVQCQSSAFRFKEERWLVENEKLKDELQAKERAINELSNLPAGAGINNAEIQKEITVLKDEKRTVEIKLAMAEAEVAKFRSLESIYASVPVAITNYDQLTLVYAFSEKREILRKIDEEKIERLDTITSQIMEIAEKVLRYKVKEIEIYRVDLEKYRKLDRALLCDYFSLVNTVGEVREHFVKHICMTSDTILSKNLMSDINVFKSCLKAPFPCERNLDSLLNKAISVDMAISNPCAKIAEVFEEHLQNCGKSKAE